MENENAQVGGRGRKRRRISFYSIYNIDQHVSRHVDSMRGFIEGILSNGRRRRILIDEAVIHLLDDQSINNKF